MDYKRIENILKRWNGLYDRDYSVSISFPQEANKDAFFKEKILEETDEKVAEQRLKKIEEVDAEWKVECEKRLYVEEMEQVMSIARKYLDETNYTQLPDAEFIDENYSVRSFTQEEKIEYREYRRYLRRIPTLYKRKQILKLKVMSFNEWKINKPVYKD